MDHQPSYVTSPKDSTTSVWLLASLSLSLLVFPLLEGLYAGRALLLVGLTATFIVGTMAARSILRAISLSLLAVALPTAWATLIVDSTPLFVAHCLLGSAFFWFVGGTIVFVVIRSHAVTFDSVRNAISAYLLFGLAWALSYQAIDRVSPDALSFLNERATSSGAEVPQVLEISKFIYYSFVTMTTLGFGDIAPLDRSTRTLSWVQAVTGQFYVAVVIAWLVSAIPRPGNDTR